MRRLSRAAQDRLADASAYAAENLSAVRTMHAFGQEATVSGRFAAAVERAFAAVRKIARPLVQDRSLSPDITHVAEAIRRGDFDLEDEKS